MRRVVTETPRRFRLASAEDAHSRELWCAARGRDSGYSINRELAPVCRRSTSLYFGGIVASFTHFFMKLDFAAPANFFSVA